jgi:uncharacterized repeat protein (TIGR03943 family)
MVAAVTRPAQNLSLVLLGGAALWITLATDEYLNYVAPWFRHPLVGAGAVLIVLGGTGLYRGRGGDHGGEHGRGSRVAWLLLLPALVIFVIAPPSLGSFSVARPDSAPAGPPAAPGSDARGSEGFGTLPGTGPIEMPIGEFVGRAWQEHYGGSPTGLRGRTVMLTGFVTRPARSGAGGWTLTRMRITCCAADGVPMQVIVTGRPAPPADSWVQVTGSWQALPPPSTDQPLQVLTATGLRRITKPREPYE